MSMMANHTDQTQATRVRRLDDSQLASFDEEYVGDKEWKIVHTCIDRHFSNRPFSFLDVGGGNGLFADRLLENYPKSRGTVLDNAEFLLSKNKRCGERKRVICESAGSLEKLFAGEQFDVIFMNWVLHHLVADSYSCTTETVKSVLQMSGRILHEQGRILIFEHMYNGWLIDNLPSHIIYHLTCCRKLAGLMKLLGANTAGVGVCFRSKRAWLRIIQDAGMNVVYTDGSRWPQPIAYKLLLHMGNIRGGHFELGKGRSSL